MKEFFLDVLLRQEYEKSEKKIQERIALNIKAKNQLDSSTLVGIKLTALEMVIEQAKYLTTKPT